MTKVIDMRIAALRRFALAITVLNIAGHFFLGFEQSIAHMLVAVAVAYVIEFVFETINSRNFGYKARYKGGMINVIDFLLPGHITALAVSMLLFTNEGIIPLIFAVAVALLSKQIFRVKMNGKSRHFLNPSNAGIAITLILFPWIGIAPPYQFTENIVGAPDWILPVIFIALGTMLNVKYTRKLPLILAWLGFFFIQAAVRSYAFGTPLVAALMPMNGVAFLLFTFYMVSDPATTPFKLKNQIAFGAGVALTYGVLMAVHIVFGLFFSLFAVCILRGAYIYARERVVESEKAEGFGGVTVAGSVVPSRKLEDVEV